GYTPDDLPKLTIGGLLMRLHRLSLLGNLLSNEQQEQLDIAQKQVENVKREWLVAYTNKTTDELIIRINEWNQFLNECRQNQDECREMYPSMVEKRVMAQVLVNEARELNVLTPEIEKRLNGIDSQLQGYFKAGSFVWDQRLQRAYPQDEYGFLYVTIL
ncbi:MAG: hypothetical protein ABI970_23675, partial [Chloroflexota bacterium]